MASLQPCSLPYCRYAGIVLHEEKFVSNILIDRHDMCVKSFIHIGLVLNEPYTKLRVAFFFLAGEYLLGQTQQLNDQRVCFRGLP